MEEQLNSLVSSLVQVVDALGRIHKSRNRSTRINTEEEEDDVEEVNISEEIIEQLVASRNELLDSLILINKYLNSMNLMNLIPGRIIVAPKYKNKALTKDLAVVTGVKSSSEESDIEAINIFWLRPSTKYELFSTKINLDYSSNIQLYQSYELDDQRLCQLLEGDIVTIRDCSKIINTGMWYKAKIVMIFHKDEKVQVQLLTNNLNSRNNFMVIPFNTSYIIPCVENEGVSYINSSSQHSSESLPEDKIQPKQSGGDNDEITALPSYYQQHLKSNFEFQNNCSSGTAFSDFDDFLNYNIGNWEKHTKGNERYLHSYQINNLSVNFQTGIGSKLMRKMGYQRLVCKVNHR